MGSMAPQSCPLDAATKIRNEDVKWDLFEPAVYWENNYARLRDDDTKILRRTEEFFSAFPPDPGATGVDVGPGANLYPALAMLPFSDEIVLWEYSKSNVRWLCREVRAYPSTWDPFWRLIARVRRSSSSDAVSDPGEALRGRTRVRHGSVFDLPDQVFDIGTMFFVAESLTQDLDEFELATRKFVASLKPGAPFAAAFMEGSDGYDVDGYAFPAVPVTIGHVEKCLLDTAADVKDLLRVDSEEPLRDGYTGMILALGRAAG